MGLTPFAQGKLIRGSLMTETRRKLLEMELQISEFKGYLRRLADARNQAEANGEVERAKKLRNAEAGILRRIETVEVQKCR